MTTITCPVAVLCNILLMNVEYMVHYDNLTSGWKRGCFIPVFMPPVLLCPGGNGLFKPCLEQVNSERKGQMGIILITVNGNNSYI